VGFVNLNTMLGRRDRFRDDETVTVQMCTTGQLTSRRWWHRLLHLPGKTIDLEREGLIALIITSEETGEQMLMLREEDPEEVSSALDELEQLSRRRNAVWN
jgi:hypothetical protein